MHMGAAPKDPATITAWDTHDRTARRRTPCTPLRRAPTGPEERMASGGRANMTKGQPFGPGSVGAFVQPSKYTLSCNGFMEVALGS